MATERSQQVDSFNASDSTQLTRRYYDSLMFDMRYLDNCAADTKFTYLGHTFDSPITISALSHLGRFGYGDDGMVAVARAAKEMNILNFCGSGSYEELEAIVETGAKTIKIFKPYEDMDLCYAKIRHAERTGAIAIGMDIDHAIRYDGAFDNLDGVPMSPKSSEELRQLIASTKLPFIVKGVMSVTDAQKALKAGASGIMVSNHHGMSPYMVPPPLALQDIVKAVGHQMTIFIDSAIESGYDAYKAIALGADAVAVARPLLQPVKNESTEGVKKWLAHANNELKATMERTGCATLADIDATRIRVRNF